MEAILFALPIILDIIAIVDVLRGYLSGAKKILWIVLIVIVPVVGAILYFLLGRPEQQSTN
ncbi:MAG: PLDc N-terminal domain-containing protein [Candidatus Omnitrophica bacterium]|nr:PLDc N-terminal domain-containing protein [Candidatus Omnitrophota bacterium]